MRSWEQHVHALYDDYGHEYWAVGLWNEDKAQYTVPHDWRTYKLTGCSASFARHLDQLPDRYHSKKQALRRARYLYHGQHKDMPF